MFILPAHAHAISLPSLSDSLPNSLSLPDPLSLGVSHWHWTCIYRVLLTALATLFVFLAVRRVLKRGKGQGVPVAVVADEKAPSVTPSPSEKDSAKQQLTQPSKWWTSVTHSLPINIAQPGPPPPPMRGGHVYRGGRGVGFNTTASGGLGRGNGGHVKGHVRKAAMVEAPLPALYASETPVSMAKMIMSRHTYRAPSSAPRRSVSHSPFAPTPSSSSTLSSQHARSASL